MKPQNGEMVRAIGSRGQVSGTEIEFGIQKSVGITEIDAISPILKPRFNDAIEMTMEERRKQNGNPKDFRENTARLAESLPSEFGEKGYVTERQISQLAEKAS